MILVVGLGLSGQSALNFLHKQGLAAVGTDSRHGGFQRPQGDKSGVTQAIVSPGVALDDPFVQGLINDGIEVIGDTELFARHVKAPVIGITGSNGKSTVTTLVGDMALAAGIKVAVGGNLGTPALDLLADDVQLYVLELSSFQLESTHSLRCHAAAWLNLSEDHLDRHHTMQAYSAAKARIFKGCGVAVVNADDPATREGSEQAQSVVAFNDRDLPFDAGILKIAGRHNHANAYAAWLLAEAAGIPEAARLHALSHFTGLPHRCKFVAEVAGVRYYNDSKGTNVGSTLAALKGFDAPLIWLGGGQGKGQDFAPLKPVLAEKARLAVVFGQDKVLLARALSGKGGVSVLVEDTLAEALESIREYAKAGDTVLLSPACASLDQFKNYNERGQVFEDTVRGFAKDGACPV
jgi:UDP-N-acetylmuramoylalanine--D-glutamate ligase